ncbi:MAG: putative peptidase [Planctomycetaceae bacterium]|nr:putative peptidase [Planctomycetaceae bacterium]
MAKFWWTCLFLMTTLVGSFAEDAKPSADEVGFVPLFNGKNLDEFEGDKGLWKLVNGTIVGDSPGIKQNEFLSTKKNFEDFELRLEFKLHGGKGNSGIQFRSKRDPKSSEVSGYQADMGEKYWGCLYDEHRRNKILAQAPPALEAALKKDDWNTYVIRAEGGHIVLKINDVTTVDYREPDPEIARSGMIAVQVHSGGPLKVEFRNLRIKELKPLTKPTK